MMTTYEYFSLTCSILMIIITFCGVMVAYVQLKKNTKAKIDDTKLTIKIETEYKLSEFNNLNIDELKKNKVLDYLNNTDNVEPLSLNIIQQEIEKNRVIKSQLHKVLNFYEALVRGIKSGIYDEQIIKDWGMNKMKRTYRKFQRYVDNRQIDNKKAWIILEEYMKENN